MRFVVAWCLVATALAGCTADTPPPQELEEETCVVEDATDFSCAEEDQAIGAQRAHVHDYWGGQDSLMIMDDVDFMGAFTIRGDYMFMMRPEADVVIPQGTQYVDVTIGFEDLLPGTWSEPVLWLRTAGTSEPIEIAPIVAGEPIRFESTNEHNDLPHQRLSAWEFFVEIQPDNAPGIVFMQTNVHMTVEAIRGLEIPLFPGHPDQWGGQDMIDLLDITAPAPFWWDDPAGNNWCLIGPCPKLIKPDEGLVVPWDADHVEVRIQHDGPTSQQTAFTLAYHGADTREFTAVQPDTDTAAERVYRIPVDGDGDGPYALQSLWEFRLIHDGHHEFLPHSGDVSLAATVYRYG